MCKRGWVWPPELGWAPITAGATVKSNRAAANGCSYKYRLNLVWGAIIFSVAALWGHNISWGGYTLCQSLVWKALLSRLILV